jgi:hypothetical protein
VHAQAESRGAPGGQHGAGLVAVERVRAGRLAEDVDPAGVRGAGVEHRAGDEGKVVGRVDAWRADVRAEERRLVGDLAGQAQQAGLLLDAEPVAALDLDGAGALAAQLRDPGGQ